MNVLQFGCGNYGKFHKRAWESLGIIPIIVDPEQGHCMPDWNYRKWDIVDIVTPPQTHAKIIMDAVGHGVQTIFCEKPLAIGLEQTELLANLDIRGYVGYGYRFVTGMRALRNHPAWIAFYGKKRPHWTRKDLYWADGVHVFDLYHYLTGEWPSRWDYLLSNTMNGLVNDPVVAGAKTTKCASTQKTIIDFSAADPVELLTRQFTEVIEHPNSPHLHTFKDSVELARQIEGALNEFAG